MYRLGIIFLISICLGFNAKKNKHPLYVSNTNVEFNSKEKSIEIICKIFTEDLEAILEKNTGKKFDLFAPQNEIAKTAIVKYLQQQLLMQIDDKSYTFSIIGYERKKEACWCYLEITNITQVKKISISNAILYDFTNKEINLMHVTVQGITKSNKVYYPEKNVVFNF